MVCGDIGVPQTAHVIRPFNGQSIGSVCPAFVFCAPQAALKQRRTTRG
jgi:hypothetical protein